MRESRSKVYLGPGDASPDAVEQPEWSQILGTHEHGDACETCLPSLMICSGCPTTQGCRDARWCAQPWRLVRASPAEMEAWLEAHR